MRAFLSALLLLISPPVRAQLIDSFADGDFTSNPAWSGTDAYWHIVPIDGQLMLGTNGPPSSDTLYLATESSTAYGSWKLRFHYDDVNLSNFNGARVFLISDVADLRGEVRGYYLQFGTNNSNEIRLYRMDGDPSSRRVELGRSQTAMVSETSGRFDIEVTRSSLDEWQVLVDDSLIITATDGTYRTSAFFGFWVKHTASTNNGYYFGNVEVTPGDAPLPDPLWVESAAVLGARRLEVRFSRRVTAASACEPGNYLIDGRPVIAQALCGGAALTDHVGLVLLDDLQPGKRMLEILQLEDDAGFIHGPLLHEFVVTDDDVVPFGIEAVTHDVRRPAQLRIRMTRDVDASYLDLALVRLEQGPTAEEVRPGADPRDIVAQFAEPIAPGTHRVIFSGVISVNEELFEGEATVTVIEPPRPRDVVINEIHFVPPDQQLEFIELYNRSDRMVDLSMLDYADDRHVFEPVTDASTLLQPGGYAVIARDSIALRTAYPGTASVQPNVWHTLNNAGDAVIIQVGGVTIDSVAYTSVWGSGNASIERIDPDGPGLAFNFAPSVDSALATPGRINSVHSTARSDVRVILAEEISHDAVEVVLEGPVDTARVDVQRILIDGGTVTDASFRSPSLLVVRHNGARPRTVRIGGLYDLYGDAVAEATVEIAAIPEVGELFINEIMYAPLADPHDGLPDQPEYLEVASTADRLITLSRIALADAVDEAGISRYISATSPVRPTLAPGAYAVFSAEPAHNDSVATHGKLARAFPQLALLPPAVTLLAANRSTLSLPLGGRLVRLVYRMDDGADDVVLDEVRYDPSWHHRAAMSTEGRSLERIRLDAPTDDPSNWSTSVAPDGGTPGHPNSVSRDVSEPVDAYGIILDPSTFSPDDDGFDDLLHIRYVLRAGSSRVRVRIFDSSGHHVRALESATFSGREGTIVWDGFDDDGRRLPIGIYIILLDAVDPEAGTAETYRAVAVLARPLGS